MAGYMFTSKTYPKKLAQRLETEEVYDIWLKTKTWTTPQYERTLTGVWNIALQELPKSAIELLYVISMLNPDAIPDEIFVYWASPDTEPSVHEWKSRRRSVASLHYKPQSWHNLKLKPRSSNLCGVDLWELLADVLHQKCGRNSFRSPRKTASRQG